MGGRIHGLVCGLLSVRAVAQLRQLQAEKQQLAGEKADLLAARDREARRADASEARVELLEGRLAAPET